MDEAPPDPPAAGPSRPEVDPPQEAEPGQHAAPGEPVPAAGDEGPGAKAIGERMRSLVEAEAARIEADERAAAEREEAAERDEPAAEPGPLIPCPMCGTAEAFPFDELYPRLAHVAERAEPWPQSSKHATCPDCQGWGLVWSGARAGESVTISCETCGGAGYVAKHLLEHPGEPHVEGNGDGLALEPEPPYRDPMRTPPPAGSPPAPGMEWSPQRGEWGYPVLAP